jgi:hypothetical protein
VFVRIFKNYRKTTDVVFRDASREFQNEKRQALATN